MLHILCDAKGSPKPKSIHLIDCRLWLHLGLQPTGNIWHQDGCFLAGVRVWFLNLFLWSNLNPFVFFFKALTLPLSFQQPTCECLFPSLLTSLAFWSSLTFGKKLSRQRQHLLCPYPLLRLYLLFLKRTNPVSKILSLHFSPLTIIHLLWSPFSFPLHHLFTSSSSSSLSVPQMQAYFCKHKQLVPNLLSHLLLCQKHAMRTWLCNKTKCSRFVEFSKS